AYIKSAMLRTLSLSLLISVWALLVLVLGVSTSSGPPQEETPTSPSSPPLPPGPCVSTRPCAPQAPNPPPSTLSSLRSLYEANGTSFRLQSLSAVFTTKQGDQLSEAFLKENQGPYRLKHQALGQKDPQIQLHAWANGGMGGVEGTLLEGEIQSNTGGLILANALHFKGLWEEDFHDETADLRSFLGTKYAKVSMMHRVGESEADALRWCLLTFGMRKGKGLHLGAVLHWASLELGSEAGEGATELEDEKVEKPKLFYADHSFMVLVRDNTTGALLLMGALDQAWGPALHDKL
uniref:Serine (or cysteine) peptidase inhibitor, clade H, member 2 n=1 Tax=Hucho hucho TaxID=62062 RepID=A0A4W5RNG2_9TELE